MSFKLSAGVYFQEYVKGSGIFNPISMTVGAACFASKKGPLGPTLITGGYEEFVQRYGNGDMQWSQAHLALKPALTAPEPAPPIALLKALNLLPPCALVAL